MTSGPKRLFESADTELAQSLGAARAHLPSTERLAAIGERLAELGLPTTETSGVKPTPETAAAPPSPPASSLWLKGVAGAIATGGVVLTLALALPGKEAAEPSAPPTRASVAAASSPAPERPAPEEGERAAPASRGRIVEPPGPYDEPLAEAARPAPVVRREPSPRKPAEPAPALPSGEAPSTSDGDAPPPAPVAKAVTAEANAGTGELRRGPLPREVELLKEARSALSSDPERALALTRRYGAEYPHGTYAQERDFIAISALARLGRGAEAKSRADAFRARYPRSAYLPQLERLLGGR